MTGREHNRGFRDAGHALVLDLVTGYLGEFTENSSSYTLNDLCTRNRYTLSQGKENGPALFCQFMLVRGKELYRLLQYSYFA